MTGNPVFLSRKVLQEDADHSLFVLTTVWRDKRTLKNTSLFFSVISRPVVERDTRSGWLKSN